MMMNDGHGQQGTTFVLLNWLLPYTCMSLRSLCCKKLMGHVNLVQIQSKM